MSRGSVTSFLSALTPLTVLVPLLILSPAPAHSTVHEYAVEVSATVQESPPRIDLSWPADATAERYLIFRKSIDDTTWGDPLAVLAGTATSFSDSDVAAGDVYEYAFRKSLSAVRETVQVSGGTPVTFTIRDTWGDGMCCRHGLGWYEVSCDGLVHASGGEFDTQESTPFVAGGPGAPVDVVVSLALDVYAVETTWTLTEDATGHTLGEGGPYEMARFGHVLAGIEAPAIEDRGGVLLLVAQDALAELPDEIARLELDLVCDGYAVTTITAPTGASVPDVKALVVDACQLDPDIGTLFILGAVPVPYSGNVWSPHSEHKGAWPADLYYGELHGEWTDDTVDNTSALRPENHNVPGDGKFDQTFLPSDVDLEVGRVDLSDLPVFVEDEYSLLRRYLDKNHSYRRGEFAVSRRGLVDDNIGVGGGIAPAALAWRYFTPICGGDDVFDLDYRTTLKYQGFLWSYGVGGGSYTSCYGVARSSDFADQTVYCVFTGLFGSYFGDWDSTSNLLRSAIAGEGWVLGSFWGGRPTWHLHRMGLGHTIGHCTRLTQNNDHMYTPGDGGRQIVPALMGDPTCKAHVVKPPGALNVTQTAHSEIGLTWEASSDAVEGYHVYRAPDLGGTFVRLNGDAVADTSYVDASPLPGQNVYMVRALKLETSASGTYHNLSGGVIDSLLSETGVPQTGELLIRLSTPFAVGSAVRYHVPAAGDVSVRIYNVAGREVRTLVDGRRDAGWHEVAWDGRDNEGLRTASGVYFCRATHRAGSASAKLILLR